jgi:polyferredoxin
MKIQHARLMTRTGFFILFIFAPILDIFRFDLYLGHFIIFGQNWTLGLEAFQNGEITGQQAVLNVFLYAFLPLLLVAGTFIGVSWFYGRLYCGWLCPHFSVVEMVNSLMEKTIGKASIWDKGSTPERDIFGKKNIHNKKLWIVTFPIIVVFAFVWAVSLITYMLPPNVIYHNLLTNQLTTVQFNFIAIATLVFTLEFTFARHLFCRFGCAVGLFQSLAWMANKSALVVRFKRDQVKECVDCSDHCNHACPMRLKPRSTKRHMFTCTQCGLCIDACEKVQGQKQQESLLHWVQKYEALDVSDRDFKQGKHFVINKDKH